MPGEVGELPEDYVLRNGRSPMATGDVARAEAEFDNAVGVGAALDHIPITVISVGIP